MRIIAGSAGSIPIKVPKSLARPTSDRVRESIFASLGDRVASARVLDLFAGSGSLGLEALSRGAAEVTFVDSCKTACLTIAENSRKTSLPTGRIITRQVLSFLSDPLGGGSYDLIFADPPYVRDEATAELLGQLLTHPVLPERLAPEGLLILETYVKRPLPDHPLWRVLREKTYGQTRVSYLSQALPDCRHA